MGKRWNQPQYVVDAIKKRQMGKGNSFYGKHHTEEHKKYISKLEKGRYVSDETRAKMGHKGPNHWNWKGGISRTYTIARATREWITIATKIRKRDKHTCQECGESPVYCVHHIIPWRISKNDNEENLVTLCRSCHGKHNKREQMELCIG